MTYVLDRIKAAARQADKTIVLSEGGDPRAVQAAIDARADGLAKIILVGPKADICAQYEALGTAPDDGTTIHDPATSPLHDPLTDAFYALRKHKGLSREEAAKLVCDPTIYAALLVREGHADGTVGGAVTTTADIVRAALQVIGTAPGTKLVSSFFLMLFDQPHHARKGAAVFSDCGLVVDPSAPELAQIASDAAHSFTTLTGEDPRVAMLSFSTKGSAQHPDVAKVAQATELAQAANPTLILDGELQFDAAFVPAVAATKAPGSPIEGAANTFIFPNLNAGNIAYKITQRVGLATALGPILQGLAKPANDLSRGCTHTDITNIIAITAVQAAAQ